jgi:prepilin-type N-terminal cleavage/methylation domain-containing protein
MNRNSGFTLVELMVTIVIISVLSNIALGRIEEYTAKARCTEAVVGLSTYERLQTTFHGFYGRYGSLGEIGMSDEDGQYFDFSSDIQVAAWNQGGGIQTAASKNNKIDICHVNPAGCNTLTVDENGWNGHDGHAGDFLGPCDANCGGKLSSSSSTPASSSATSSAATSSAATSSIAASSSSQATLAGETATMMATSKTSLSIYCREGDGVFTTFSTTGNVRGNTTGGNCGRYMGAWFRQ